MKLSKILLLFVLIFSSHHGAAAEFREDAFEEFKTLAFQDDTLAPPERSSRAGLTSLGAQNGLSAIESYLSLAARQRVGQKMGRRVWMQRQFNNWNLKLKAFRQEATFVFGRRFATELSVRPLAAQMGVTFLKKLRKNSQLGLAYTQTSSITLAKLSFLLSF